MIDIVRPLPIAGSDQISAKQGHDLLFELYDLEKLQ